MGGYNALSKIVFVPHLGELTVSVFLIISTYFLYSRGGRTNFSLIQFYKKRFFRLWLIYAICVSLIFLGSFVFKYTNFTCNWKDWLLNITFLNGFIGTPYVDGAHWYMTTLISLIFVVGIIKQLHLDKNILTYVTWIALAAGSKGVAMLIQILGGSSVLTLPFLAVYKVLGGGFIGIGCMGIILHMFMTENLNTKMDKMNAAITVLLSVAYTIIMTNIWRTIGAIVGVVCVYNCMKDLWHFMSNKVFVWLGTISYEFYLIHQRIGYGIESTLSEYFGGYSIGVFFVSMLFCILLAVLINKVGKIILKKISHRESEHTVSESKNV
jgi:peptidoglycan/LPS O-acetylase OafA/YrhL